MIYRYLKVASGMIFVLSMLSCSCGPTTKQIILRRDSLETVNGVVDTLYDDRENHNVRTAIMTNKVIFRIVPEWRDSIDMGDSLFKKKGEFFLYVFKKNNQTLVLNYRLTISPDLH